MVTGDAGTFTLRMLAAGEVDGTVSATQGVLCRA